jgi:putative dehydrogenase
MTSVAILAAGNMGAGLGARLREHGVDVSTCLAGRSAATQARAKEAGLRDVAFEDLFTADVFLSVVPPGDAIALAETALPHLRARGSAIAYVDCNAINPETACRIGTILSDAECTYLDASIIGGPPSPGQVGPVLYVSGTDCAPLLALAAHGLRIRALGPEIGTASALKMAYGGITKGFTAVAAVQLLGASRAGVDTALLAELAESQPNLLAWMRRQVPGMIPKAYRWVAEMQEIAGFLAADAASEATFEAIADFYVAMAADEAGTGANGKSLKNLLKT